MPPDLNVYPRPRGAIPRAALHTMGLYNLLDLSFEGIQQWAYLKVGGDLKRGSRSPYIAIIVSFFEVAEQLNRLV